MYPTKDKTELESNSNFSSHLPSPPKLSTETVEFSRKGTKQTLKSSGKWTGSDVKTAKSLRTNFFSDYYYSCWKPRSF